MQRCVSVPGARRYLGYGGAEVSGRFDGGFSAFCRDAAIARLVVGDGFEVGHARQERGQFCVMDFPLMEQFG